MKIDLSLLVNADLRSEASFTTDLSFPSIFFGRCVASLTLAASYDSLDGEPEVLLDPNGLSKDGTVAISICAVSEDAKYLAYGLSSSGSDWVTIKVMESENLDAGTETNANLNHEVYYHFLGTNQSEDILCWRDPDNSKHTFGTCVTDDGKINTCNGFYCDQFTPNSATKPKMWTENWTRWFLSFGGAVPYRPVEDIAFDVARFFQRGGTFQNYYMYHGGTNFGRTTGGPFIATSYDYDALILNRFLRELSPL
ncbi:hypothetical protein ACSBR1_027424 [Camellia fascicularis]